MMKSYKMKKIIKYKNYLFRYKRKRKGTVQKDNFKSEKYSKFENERKE